MFAPGAFAGWVQTLAGSFLQHFDGWTLFISTTPLLLCAAVFVLPQGKWIIGGPKVKPEFRTITWTSMMFAAGMGAGLVFWGAAEPLIHLGNPPPGSRAAPNTEEARRISLAITQFHWSLHAWAIYAVSAMAIGLVIVKGQPVLPSAPFTEATTRVRRAVDFAALLAVLFGLVASLGQGAIQVGAGLQTMTGGFLEDNLGLRITFVTFLTAAYLGSALLGLRRGIAVLSNINLVLAGLLCLFILALGPTGDILRTVIDTVVAYFASLPELSFTLRPEGPARDWTRDWSLTYFLWWIAWTPFVGVFLARISRGRSLRSFVLASVVLPSFVTLLWFSILGGAAVTAQTAGTDLGISNFDTAPLATYRLLEVLPLTTAAQLLAVVLVIVFLITSADSGAFVLAMFSEQDSNPSVTGRIAWGLILALLTGAAILSDEGQNVTRAMAVAGSIPLTFLLAAQGGSVAWRFWQQRGE